MIFTPDRGRVKMPAWQQKILVIEDDQLVAWSIRKALEKRGYGVTIAETGDRARELLSSQRFHLVIVDRKFPDIREYWTVPGSPPPAIFVSTDVDPPSVENTHDVRLGPEKPFFLDEIEKMVVRMLDE